MVILPDTEKSVIVSPYSFTTLNSGVEEWFTRFTFRESTPNLAAGDVFRTLFTWHKLTEFALMHVEQFDRIDLPLAGFFPFLVNRRVDAVFLAQRDIVTGMITLSVPRILSGIEVIKWHMGRSYIDLHRLILALDTSDSVFVEQRIDTTLVVLSGMEIFFDLYMTSDRIRAVCAEVGLQEAKFVQNSTDWRWKNGY